MNKDGRHSFRTPHISRLYTKACFLAPGRNYSFPSYLLAFNTFYHGIVFNSVGQGHVVSLYSTAFLRSLPFPLNITYLIFFRVPDVCFLLFLINIFVNKGFLILLFLLLTLSVICWLSSYSPLFAYRILFLVAVPNVNFDGSCHILLNSAF